MMLIIIPEDDKQQNDIFKTLITKTNNSTMPVFLQNKYIIPIHILCHLPDQLRYHLHNKKCIIFKNSDNKIQL